MNEVILVMLSILYLTSLAVVDGLFNRLVFRNKRKLSYFSEYKQHIYKRWEWKAIGIIFLIILPVVLPSFTAFIVGGFSFVTLYWVVLLVVPWDIIFGRLVFDDWFGDRPSIALPFYGWINLPLWPSIIIRVVLAVFLYAARFQPI